MKPLLPIGRPGWTGRVLVAEVGEHKVIGMGEHGVLLRVRTEHFNG